MVVFAGRTVVAVYLVQAASGCNGIPIVGSEAFTSLGRHVLRARVSRMQALFESAAAFWVEGVLQEMHDGGPYSEMKSLWELEETQRYHNTNEILQNNPHKDFSSDHSWNPLRSQSLIEEFVRSVCSCSLIPCSAAQVTNSLLSCMVRLALGSHLLLLLVLQSNYYACRDGLTLASACLLKTTPVQTMVVILWGQLMSAALEPWWGVGCHVRMYNQKGTAMRGGFYWACWICLLLLVSCP